LISSLILLWSEKTPCVISAPFSLGICFRSDLVKVHVLLKRESLLLSLGSLLKSQLGWVGWQYLILYLCWFSDSFFYGFLRRALKSPNWNWLQLCLILPLVSPGSASCGGNSSFGHIDVRTGQ
jgi:hypothetical protein